MGLDQSIYVKKSTFKPVRLFEGNELPEDLKSFQVDSISSATYYEIGYFRKFNALHNYIRSHFTRSGEILNNQEVHLSEENMVELVKVFQLVSEDHSLAEKCLPTCEGFFFGSLEYDSYYFEDIKKAEELFTNIIMNLPKDYEVIYSAWW